MIIRRLVPGEEGVGAALATYRRLNAEDARAFLAYDDTARQRGRDGALPLWSPHGRRVTAWHGMEFRG
jgi:hypothetical protein